MLFGLGFALALMIFSLAANAAGDGFDFAGMKLPPGFTATPYVRGVGFDPSEGRNAPGLPAIVTITFDSKGALYFARTANRLSEIYGTDYAPIYRISPGPATIKVDNEKKILFGPTLSDPDEAEVDKNGDVFVNSENREEGFGSLYKLSSTGEAVLFAGGPPAPGSSLLLKNPEGIAFDPAGNVYVVDYDIGVVVKLDR